MGHHFLDKRYLEPGHQFQALEERDPEILCRRILVGLCILYLPVAILIKSLGNLIYILYGKPPRSCYTDSVDANNILSPDW